MSPVIPTGSASAAVRLAQANAGLRPSPVLNNNLDNSGGMFGGGASSDQTSGNAGSMNNPFSGGASRLQSSEGNTATTTLGGGQTGQKDNTDDKSPMTKMPLMRYAPVAMNTAQYLGTLGQKPETVKPETVQAQRLTDRMDYRPTDTNYVVNQLRQRFAGQDRALQSGSLGSGALANLYQMQANRDRGAAEAEAWRTGERENMARKAQATQFNAGIASQNAQMDMQAQQFNAQARSVANLANEQNKAALTNERSALLSGIGTQLGQVGNEKYSGNIATKLGLGYDQYLNYSRKSKGGKLYLPKVKKK